MPTNLKHGLAIILTLYSASSSGAVVDTILNAPVLYSVGSVNGYSAPPGQNVRIQISYNDAVTARPDDTLNPSEFLNFPAESRMSFTVFPETFQSQILQINEVRDTQLGPFSGVDFFYAQSGPIDTGTGMYQSLEFFFLGPSSTIFPTNESTQVLLNAPVTSLAQYYFGRVSECSWGGGCNEIVFGNANPINGEISAIPEPSGLLLTGLGLAVVFSMTRRQGWRSRPESLDIAP